MNTRGPSKLFALSEIKNNRSLTAKYSVRISQNYALRVFELTGVYYSRNIGVHIKISSRLYDAPGGT